MNRKWFIVIEELVYKKINFTNGVESRHEETAFTKFNVNVTEHSKKFII